VERLVEPHAGVTIVTLDRPAARNSLGKNLLGELQDAVAALHHDRETRVVIFNSAVEKVFCAGADLKERATMPEEEVGPFVERLRATFTAIEQLPMPTIAAIEGAALGGGLELALGCDLRVAGNKAVLGVPETSLAIIPGAGGTQRLPRLIGLGRAKELMFTADRIGSERAEEIGLVNYAVEGGTATDRALDIAARIAKNGPIAVRLAKKAASAGMQADISTGMDIERGCYAQVITTKDRLEGLAAFREKRMPNYTSE